MRKSKAIFRLILIVAVMAGLMIFAAACKDNASGSSDQEIGNDTPNVSNPPKNEPQNEPKNEPVELYFLSQTTAWWKEDEFMKDYGDAIQKKFPHVIPKAVVVPGITVEEMNSLIMNKQPIDIILSTNYMFEHTMKPFDLQMDIDPIVKRNNVDLSRFDDAAVEAARKLGVGKLLAIPFSETPTWVIYNKGIFDRFGVEHPPHDRWTWDEMNQLGDRLNRTDGDITYFGLRVDTAYFNRNAYSLQFVDPTTNKVNFNNEIGQKLLMQIVRPYEKSDLSAINAFDWGHDLFYRDKVLAMEMPANYVVPVYEALEGVDWDFAPSPYLPEKGDVGLAPYPSYLFLSSISKQQDLAMEVMDFMTSKEFIMDLSKAGIVVPTLKDPELLDVFGQESPELQGKNLSAFKPEKYALPTTYDSFNAFASSSLGQEVIEIVKNTKDLNTALRDVEEKVNQFIQEKLSAK